MARGALNWTLRNLAAKAGLSHNTAITFEAGHQVRDSTVARLRSTLEAAGVRFDGSTTVTLEAYLGPRRSHCAS